MSPTQLWGVGEITLTSAAFEPMVLVPATDSSGGEIEHRWANFAVMLDEDTLDSWPVDDTTVVANAAVRNPFGGYSVISGSYSITVELPDGQRASEELELFGLRRSVNLEIIPDVFKLPTPWGAGRVVSYTIWDPPAGTPQPRTSHVALVDLRTGAATVLADVNGWSSLLAPGPSYDAQRVVLDLDGAAQPSVSYRVAGQLQPGDSLDCYAPNAISDFLVAEVGPGRCLGWYSGGYYGPRGIWADGVTLLAEVPLPLLGAFVISPDSRHTIPTMKYGCSGIFPPNSPTSWWVFDDTPAIAYTLDGVGCVTGASFTPGGDTLFITAQEPIPEGSPPPGWRVEARDSENGTLIASWVLEEEGGILLDVLADPVLPWLYVQDARGLWVLRRGSLDVVARIPAFAGPASLLIHGGSAGTLYLWTTDHGHWASVLEFDILAEVPE